MDDRLPHIVAGGRLVPEAFENVLNDPVAFVQSMMPNIKLDVWQKEMLRSLEDPRWQLLIRGRL